MGRDDHAPPSRGKRPPPTTLKYDPAAASYDAYAAPYTDEAATGGSKRKRVKKERDDEWTDDRAHMTMPTILHRGGGVSTLMSTPPPPPPPPADIPAAPAPEYAVPYTHQTVFNGAPAEIVSFAETERRRSSATASSSNASLNHLVHTDESASTVATPKPTSASNGGLPWGNRRGGNGTMSVFDLFFPDQHRGRDQGSKSSSGRESKRRKRNNNGDSSSSRSSRRSAVVSSENYDVDMLRFTVDAFKLIPQGLVDRIDSRLRSDLVVSLISSHVDNWIKRIAFDDHNTLQEITSLLNAYYPCTYPTILDEVLVAFVFKRPELMEGMLKAMIERLQKTGESASPTKYPVVESFARKCGAGRVSASSKRERSRHDLACLTVLRLLLERNTEKCVLSPWIASCAADCSDEVLNIFWENLLQFHSPNVKQASLSWNIQEPLDQIFEVLREEKVLVRRGDIDNCRLSMTLIQKLTQDHTYKELRQVQFACEAFEAFFGSPVSPVTSRSLIRDWIEHEVRRGSDRSDAVHTVARVLVHNCSRLSVKKTNWFTKHVLGVLLSPDEPTREVVFPSVLNDILLSNSSLLFGGADKKDFDELDASNAGSSMQQYSSIVGMPSSNEKHTVDDVFVQIAELVGAVSRLPKHIMTEFFRHWSEAWCAPHVFVPWSYVLGLARFCVEKQSEHLTMLSKDLVVNHLGWVFKHENVVSLLPRLGVIVKVAIFRRNQKAASALMASLVESINTLPLESMVRSRASALVGSILIDQLSARQGPIQESRLQHLRAIYDLISRDDATGQFVRNCVLARRRLDGVIISSLDSDAQEAEQVLRVARSAIRLGSSAARSEFFLSSATIESIIVHGYSARNDSIRQEAIGILDASASSSRSRDLVLWSVIRYCTKVCCGCGQLNHTDREPDSTLVASTHFADLTRNILVRVPIDVLVHVGEFIRQNLEGSKGHWNTYVVQVLDRTIQLGWSKIRFVPRIVHLVLTPFDGHFASDESERVTHLRLLRSFCNALLSGFANRQGQKQHEACVSFARLVVSEQLQLKLRRIETRSSCSTAVSLAQSVLKLRGSIRVKLERYLAGAAVQKLLL